jgi:hypothetical protein
MLYNGTGIKKTVWGIEIALKNQAYTSKLSLSHEHKSSSTLVPSAARLVHVRETMDPAATCGRSAREASLPPCLVIQPTLLEPHACGPTETCTTQGYKMAYSHDIL